MNKNEQIPETNMTDKNFMNPNIAFKKQFTPINKTNPQEGKFVPPKQYTLYLHSLIDEARNRGIHFGRYAREVVFKNQIDFLLDYQPAILEDVVSPDGKIVVLGVGSSYLCISARLNSDYYIRSLIQSGKQISREEEIECRKKRKHVCVKLCRDIESEQSRYNLQYEYYLLTNVLVTVSHGSVPHLLYADPDFRFLVLEDYQLTLFDIHQLVFEPLRKGLPFDFSYYPELEDIFRKEIVKDQSEEELRHKGIILNTSSLSSSNIQFNGPETPLKRIHQPLFRSAHEMTNVKLRTGSNIIDYPYKELKSDEVPVIDKTFHDLISPEYDSIGDPIKPGTEQVIQAICHAWAVKLIQIIKQIHRCGYIHGDIKPNNIMINIPRKLLCILLARTPPLLSECKLNVELALELYHTPVTIIDFNVTRPYIEVDRILQMIELKEEALAHRRSKVFYASDPQLIYSLFKDDTGTEKKADGRLVIDISTHATSSPMLTEKDKSKILQSLPPMKHCDFDMVPGRFNTTPLYASIFAHQGYTMTRRDDIEMIMYSIAFLEKGYLPWGQNVTATRLECGHETFEIFKSMRKQFFLALCATPISEIPNKGDIWIEGGIRHARSLGFSQPPCYRELIRRFQHSSFLSVQIINRAHLYKTTALRLGYGESALRSDLNRPEQSFAQFVLSKQKEHDDIAELERKKHIIDHHDDDSPSDEDNENTYNNGNNSIMSDESLDNNNNNNNRSRYIQGRPYELKNNHDYAQTKKNRTTKRTSITLGDSIGHRSEDGNHIQTNITLELYSTNGSISKNHIVGSSKPYVSDMYHSKYNDRKRIIENVPEKYNKHDYSRSGDTNTSMHKALTSGTVHGDQNNDNNHNHYRSGIDENDVPFSTYMSTYQDGTAMSGHNQNILDDDEHKEYKFQQAQPPPQNQVDTSQQLLSAMLQKNPLAKAKDTSTVPAAINIGMSANKINTSGPRVENAFLKQTSRMDIRKENNNKGTFMDRPRPSEGDVKTRFTENPFTKNDPSPALRNKLEIPSSQVGPSRAVDASIPKNIMNDNSNKNEVSSQSNQFKNNLPMNEQFDVLQTGDSAVEIQF